MTRPGAVARWVAFASCAGFACSRPEAPPSSHVSVANPVNEERSLAPIPLATPFIDAAPAASSHHDTAPESGTPPHAVDVARAEPAIRHIPFAPNRSAFVVMPRAAGTSPRLLAMIHGVCTPPSYVCGAWRSAASDVGLLVCPTGNATCGPEGTGSPTWEEPFADIDADLERSIDAVRRRVKPAFTRKGAILAGYSRGGYVAVITAVRHPGRWPFLIINEADVDLTLPMLRAAGVRSVALIAGEWGTQIAGERRTTAALAANGYPARLWVMGRVGHPYSSDIDAIMQEAMAFVLSSDTPTPPSVP
jgi:pimeloyl-ACP methyl ester carboxylesterase